MLVSCLHLLGRQLSRGSFAVASRFVMTLVGVAALAGFSLVLPTYRDSFTLGLERAAFDWNVACSCTEAQVSELRRQPGVDRVVPALGIAGVIVTFDEHAEPAFAWAIDDAADAAATPLGPRYLVDGEVSLGSSDSPSVVIDHELARLLEAKVGSDLQLSFADVPVDVRVSGITGPMARLRGGPTLLVPRAALLHLIPVESEIRDYPYTELFVSGNIDRTAMTAPFPAGSVAIYSRDELLALQHEQIELSQPVIEVVSAIATLAFLVLLGLLAWQGHERWRQATLLAFYYGRAFPARAGGLLCLEAPTVAAVTAGTMLGIQVMVNGYFAGIGAMVPLAVAALWSLASGTIVVALLVAIYAAAELRRAPWSSSLG